MTRVVLAAATLVGLLRFVYKYFDLLVVGARADPVVPFVEELTAAYGAAVLLLALIGLMRRLRMSERRPALRVACHVVAALLFSAAHTTLNWSLRLAIFGMLARRYSYGAMPDRYAMELPMDLIVYSLFLAAVHGVDRLRAARAAEVEGARLQGSLLEAQLRSLRTQLEPHFLFNSLNTISSTMYDDPRAADEMIGHLSDLLRASLESGGRQEVPLVTELESLDHYVALLRARFGDRLSLNVQVEESLNTRVPAMIIQPLVENAARHGAPGGAKLAVVVRVAARGDTLRIEVRDDGVGVKTAHDPLQFGIGLGAARERLHLLYGDRVRFTAGNVPSGGFRVVIEIPRRTDDARPDTASARSMA